MESIESEPYDLQAALDAINEKANKQPDYHYKYDRQKEEVKINEIFVDYLKQEEERKKQPKTWFGPDS